MGYVQTKIKFNDYDEFVKKFESKKTTDDCYTPDNIYNAVLDYCCRYYGIKPEQAVRPFFPDMDYELFDYPDDCVVVDNPPFSILAEICKHYNARGIKYFLFAPSMTLGINHATGISVNCSIVYANGATVPTSFLTNLEDLLIRTAPDLYKAIERENNKNIKQSKKQVGKYVYPPEVITPALFGKYSKYGIDIKIKRTDAYPIDALDSQRAKGKAIFGCGYLLSKRASEEMKRASEEVFTLSDREREIIEKLGGDNEQR